MTKQQLRQHFSAQRHQLTQQALMTQSDAIAQQFFSGFSLTAIHNVHVFLPILSQNEINTWLIIKAIWRTYPHIFIVTSKTELATGIMSSYHLTPDTQIAENRWHVPEPVNASPIADSAIEMILIPLLCFDKQGYRVGYGKGCYDKFLSHCSPQIIKVGLSLFAPVATIDDIQPHDIKLDYAIMPHAIWRID
jgi:5-formyltetrahydrofolate cyclo-ligase